MKKVFLRVMISILIVCIITAFMPINDVLLVKHEVYLRDKKISDSFEKDLLSKNDTTYVALRDIADVFDCAVVWNAEKERITLLKNNPEKEMITNEQCAMEIGKAMISDFFSEHINDESRYSLSEGKSANGNYYFVFAAFNAGQSEYESLDYIADAMVQINRSTWEISVFSWNEEGYWLGLEGTPSENKIMDREHLQ